MTPAGESGALRLAAAKAVCWLAKPLNRLTLWAARVVVEDRLSKREQADTYLETRAAALRPGEGSES